MKNINRIPINIWDDYFEDGFVPEGEKQATYAYVENNEIPLDDQKNCLEVLIKYMSDSLNLKGVDLSIVLYDSKIKYPNIKEESLHFIRWELIMENLTHKRREGLVEELNNAKLSIDGVSFEIYSES